MLPWRSRPHTLSCCLDNCRWRSFFFSSCGSPVEPTRELITRNGFAAPGHGFGIVLREDRILRRAPSDPLLLRRDGCGTNPVFAVVLRGAAARRCSRLLSRVFPPSAIVEGGVDGFDPLEKRVCGPFEGSAVGVWLADWRESGASVVAADRWTRSRASSSAQERAWSTTRSGAGPGK